MPSVVFDASAILALLRSEVGADIVSSYIGDGVISAVNLQEVVKELVRQGISVDASLEMLDALHLDVRAHDREGAISAAALYPEAHKHGCGLGDRTCLALAIAEKLPALTADKVWERVEVAGLQVKLVR